MFVSEASPKGIFVSGIVVCLGDIVGVGIKFIRPKIIGIRLKDGGLINFIVIQDANIILVESFNVIVVVRFLDNIFVGFGRIKIIFGKIFIFVGRFDFFFKKSSTDAFGRHSKSGTPPLISS
jgi:hypothetical protein